MSLDIQYLKYIRNAVPYLVDLGYEKDPTYLLNWYTLLESSFESLEIPENLQLKYASTRLDEDHYRWAKQKEFKSFAHLKYELFNKEYPFRVELARYVRPNVNQIKNLLDNQNPAFFEQLPLFASKVFHIYEILAPYEDRLATGFESIVNSQKIISDWNDAYRETRIKTAEVQAKNEDDLTEEEEELLLNDNGTALWDTYKEFTSSFLTQALRFSLASNTSTKKYESIKLGKLSVKILGSF